MDQHGFHVHVASALGHGGDQEACLAVFDAVMRPHTAGSTTNIIVTSGEGDLREVAESATWPNVVCPIARVDELVALGTVPPVDVLLCVDLATFDAVQNSIVAEASSLKQLRRPRGMLALHIVCSSAQRLPLLYQLLTSSLAQRVQQTQQQEGVGHLFALENEAAGVIEQFGRVKAVEVAHLLLPAQL